MPEFHLNGPCNVLRTPPQSTSKTAHQLPARTSPVTAGPLAHSKNASGVTHLLRDHSEAVARVAAASAAAFDSAGFSLCAGLWHDLGKNAEDFQLKLAGADDAHVEGAPGRVDHSTA